MFPDIIKYQKSIDFIPKCSNKTNEFMIIKTFSNLHFCLEENIQQLLLCGNLKYHCLIKIMFFNIKY